MRKYIFITICVLPLFLCGAKVSAQSMDTLIYTLVNHIANQYYEKIYQFQKSDNARKFDLLIDAKVAPNDELRLLSGAYVSMLQSEILRDTSINEFRVYWGKYEGIDTLRWGSLKHQEKHPPIAKWDSCRIDKKFTYSRDYWKDGNRQDVPYTLVPINAGYVKKGRKKTKIEYVLDGSAVSVKYGLQIAYPLLFEYNNVIYGFSAIQYKAFKEHHGYSPSYYLSRWDGEKWKIIERD